MRVLVGCEESQVVCKAFRERGHETFSCDLQECSGGHPEWHYQQDIFDVIDLGWDLAIFHPPCTFLTVSGNKWFYHPDDAALPVEARRPHPRFPNRRAQQTEAINFVKKLWNCGIPRIAIENPVGVLSTYMEKPTQIIQPYMFGDEATKITCLWLRGLPELVPTNVVGKGGRTVYKSGKSHATWYSDVLYTAKTGEERSRLRSKTFPGIAEAMATQWGALLPHNTSPSILEHLND